MKPTVLIVAVLLFVIAVKSSSAETNESGAAMQPVLIELFTSEGCSSCPPADALLVRLNKKFAGSEVITLSEHVDYWNGLGWRDPFSQPIFTERQKEYCARLHQNSCYTPQIVVDGVYECVGSDEPSATRELQHASRNYKIPLAIKKITANEDFERFQLSLSKNKQYWGKASVYVAVVQERAASQVLLGENIGRKLIHESVVLDLLKISEFQCGNDFVTEAKIPLRKYAAKGKLRFVAFAQLQDSKKIVAVAMLAN